MHWSVKTHTSIWDDELPLTAFNNSYIIQYKKNIKARLTEIAVRPPEEKKQFNHELLRFLGNRKYLLGIYIRFGSHKYSPFRQHERGRRCHIRIFPTLRKKTVLLRTASSLSSCSGSLTQSTVPNEEKHKSYLFLSLLLRGFSKINILEVFVPWISLFVPSQLSLYAVFVIFQIQITFLTTYA